MHRHQAEIAELASGLPPEDQTDLTTLYDPSMLSQWALSRVEYHRKQVAELEKFISKLHSIHNITLPVRRLPAEVLMTIFADPGLPDPKLGLTQVCRYWREVVLATPQFWVNVIANLDPPKRPATLKAWIMRSKSKPLQLDIKQYHLERWRGHLLPKLANRITDLVIQDICNDDWPILQEILGLQWTCLVRFTCSPPHEPSPPVVDPRVVCSEHTFPLLCDLSISGVCLASTSTTSSLRTLKVLGAVRDVTSIVPALNRCPVLEFLTFRKFSLGLNTHTVPTAHVLPMVELPHLKQLDISSDTPRVVDVLLSRLILPPSAQILFASERAVRLPLDSPAFRSTPGIDRVLLGLECDEFDSEPTERGFLRRLVAYCYAEDWIKMKFEVGDNSFSADSLNLAHIMGPFDTLSVTTLSIYTSESEEACLPEDWMSVLLHAFPKLRRLELLREMLPQSKLQAATEFLQAQDEQDDSGGLTLVWAIPCVGAWHPTDPTQELRDLMELLRTRRAEGKATLQRLELRHPEYRLITLPPDPALWWAKGNGRDGAVMAAEYDESIIDELNELVDEVVVLVEPETPRPTIRETTVA